MNFALLTFLFEEAGTFDAEFWTKILGCAVLILIAVPVLIFVKPRDKNLNRALKKRLSDFNRSVEKYSEAAKAGGDNFSYTRRELFGFQAKLNAVQKLSQQASYENDNVAIDTVRTKVAEARDLLLAFRLTRESEPHYLDLLAAARANTLEAERTLDGILDNERRIRSKKTGKI